MEISSQQGAVLRAVEERTLIEMFAARMTATMRENAYAAAHRQMRAADGRLALLWSEIALEIARASFDR